MKQVATVLFSVGLTLLILVAVWEITPYIEQTIEMTATESPPLTITTKDNYTHNIYRINISAKCLKNHSVGNEWYADYKIDGVNIYDGQKVSVPVDVRELIIDTCITEKDKEPDTAEKAITLDLSKTESIKTQITVTENGGAYKGHTALWEITVSAELIKME